MYLICYEHRNQFIFALYKIINTNTNNNNINNNNNWSTYESLNHTKFVCSSPLKWNVGRICLHWQIVVSTNVCIVPQLHASLYIKHQVIFTLVAQMSRVNNACTRMVKPPIIAQSQAIVPMPCSNYYHIILSPRF